MKKSLMGKTSVLLLMVLFFSCITIAAAFAQSDKEILAIADPLVDKLTKAMESKDYKTYMNPWIPSAKAMMTKESFEKTCDATISQMGTFQSKSFYNIVKKESFLVIQWKAKYSRVPEDLYLQLVLLKEKGKYLVAGHWIKTQPAK